MSFNKKEQIEFILRGDLFSLLECKFGSPPFSNQQIMGSIDFSRAEALEHVTKYGFPIGSYSRGAGNTDGIHLDIVDQIWEIYYQERGVKNLVFKSNDPNKIRETLMDLMIYLSGLTGAINFEPIFDDNIVKSFFADK